MDANSVFGVQDGVFILNVHKYRVVWRPGVVLAWPAVSKMSQSYSTPLSLTVLEKLVSMVG